MSIEDLTAERDLYRRLVELGHQEQVGPLLKAALELVAQLAKAERGYLELRNPSRPDTEAICHTYGVLPETAALETETFRRAISSGVIQKALAKGSTISTASALTDARFADRESVQNGKIESVLCAPVGRPPFGVIYLQGRPEPGPFGAADRERVELCAAQIGHLAERLLLREAQTPDPTARLRARFDLEDVVGRSGATAVVLEELCLAAPLDVSVLLTGPTGTGKTHLAHVLHRNSRRARGPLVVVNCAALPETLVESELFGAERGAHSTALEDRPGRVAAAEGGTLVLDEVGELSLTVQAKLLQLLQSRTYHPLGSQTEKRADIRVVAATNRDLEAALAERTFREDLYYRLQVLTVAVPSLDDRRDDIQLLAEYACRRAVEVHGLPPLELSLGATQALETAEWPGNLRQLMHAVEGAAIRAAGEGMRHIEPRHVFPSTSTPPSAPPRSFQAATRLFQKELLSRALEETDWNVREAAQRLELARSYLYKLIQAHELTR